MPKELRILLAGLYVMYGLGRDGTDISSYTLRTRSSVVKNPQKSFVKIEEGEETYQFFS